MEFVDLSKRYRIDGVIGRGGMGEVIKTFDTRLNRPVAIKRMRADLANSRSALQRFSIEARALGTLDHPNIVRVYDYGRDAQGPFLILEFVQRGPPVPLYERDVAGWRIDLSYTRWASVFAPIHAIDRRIRPNVWRR